MPWINFILTGGTVTMAMSRAVTRSSILNKQKYISKGGHGPANASTVSSLSVFTKLVFIATA